MLTIDQLDIVKPVTEGRAHVVYTENVAKNNTAATVVPFPAVH